MNYKLWFMTKRSPTTFFSPDGSGILFLVAEALEAIEKKIQRTAGDTIKESANDWLQNSANIKIKKLLPYESSFSIYCITELFLT